MGNVLKTGLVALEREAKTLSNIGNEVVLTFSGNKARFYVCSASNSSISVLNLKTEENLDDLLATIKTDVLVKMLKGVKQGDYLTYTNATIQVVKRSKAVTINVMDIGQYSTRVPTLTPTNSLRVDTKRIVAFVKEAKDLFKATPSIWFKQQERELILECVHGADSIVEAIAIEPLKGAYCECRYGADLLLEVLGAGKECIVEFGHNYPLQIRDEQEEYTSIQILAPVVNND